MRRLMIITCVAGVAAVAVCAAQTPAQPQEAPRIAYEEFKKLADQDAVLIVDVRGRESYVNGHIPGAIAIRLDEVESKAAELLREKRPIVTYCA